MSSVATVLPVQKSLPSSAPPRRVLALMPGMLAKGRLVYLRVQWSRRVAWNRGWGRSSGEMLSLYTILPSLAPLVLVAFGVGGGQVGRVVWTKDQATAALRQVVAMAGVQPDECALHSLENGGAT